MPEQESPQPERVVLDLDAVIEPDRQTVRLHGREYDILNMEDLSPIEIGWVDRQRKRIAAMISDAEEAERPPTAAEKETLNRRIHDLLSVIIDGWDDDLAGALDSRDAEALALVIRFFVRPAMTAAPEQTATDPDQADQVTPPTGSTSPPGLPPDSDTPPSRSTNGSAKAGFRSRSKTGSGAPA